MILYYYFLITFSPIIGYCLTTNSQTVQLPTISDTIIKLSLTTKNLHLLFQRLDSMTQLYFKNLESRLIKKQKSSIDSSMERILNHIHSDTNKPKKVYIE